MANATTLPSAGASGAQTESRPQEQRNIEADVDLLLWSANLSVLRRFYRQPYWEREAQLSDEARKIEGDIPLESVAEHSWKVADAAALLVDRFSNLDRGRCIELAIIHDKLELLTGDYSPIDPDASGKSTHAFNPEAALIKTDHEVRALESYLSRLRPNQREYQRELYLDVIHMRSDDARFVCGLDKLAALMYIVQKKPEGLVPKHYDFTLSYSAKSFAYFEGLRPYHNCLAKRLRQASR